jgi:hypothetical protein
VHLREDHKLFDLFVGGQVDPCGISRVFDEGEGEQTVRGCELDFVDRLLEELLL